MRFASAWLAAACGAVLLLASAAPAAPAPDRVQADTLASSAARADTAGGQPRAIMYYFHRTLRCHTCLTIEATIDRALKTHFPGALEDGRLLWRPVNIEEPDNTHFAEDFALEYNSAILVRLESGKVVSWTNIEEVWDLVENEEAFVALIRDRVAPLFAGETKRAPSGAEP